jgi:hypothetical protein
MEWLLLRRKERFVDMEKDNLDWLRRLHDSAAEKEERE